MRDSNHNNPLTFEFHVAKKIRDKYELNDIFFSLTGNVVFANFYQVRVFTQKLNDKRNINDHLSPGEVNAVGLIDEIYHLAINKYFKQVFPNAFSDAISYTKEKLSQNKMDSLLLDFINVFPPQLVLKNELTPEQYLNQYSENVPNREVLLEELIILHISNINPAFEKLKELFSEEYISDKLTYKQTLLNVEHFFKNQNFTVGGNNNDLFSFLKNAIPKILQKCLGSIGVYKK